MIETKVLLEIKYVSMAGLQALLRAHVVDNITWEVTLVIVRRMSFHSARGQLPHMK